MARRVSAFRKDDIKKALKAVADAGLDVAKLSIGPDGVITVITTRESVPPAIGDAFDQWKAKRDAHTA